MRNTLLMPLILITSLMCLLTGADTADRLSTQMHLTSTLPSEEPHTAQELAFHWAPIHYQDVNKKAAAFHDDNGSKDFITSVDRNGTWDLSKNYKISRYKWSYKPLRKSITGIFYSLSYPLEAWVYYSVLSSTSHHYITYAFYHPLDWDSSFEEKNDMEGALLIIKRDETNWGTLEAMITVVHRNFETYFPRGTPLISGCKIESQSWCWIQWRDGRVITSQEWGGHPLRAYPAYVRKGGETVVYIPSERTAGVPPLIPDGGTVEVPYRLVDIHASGGLWDHRYDPKVFNKDEAYLQFVGGHGNPPWGWDDHNDGDLCLKGVLTHDPALLCQYYFKLKPPSRIKAWQYFSRDYGRNPYRDDRKILTDKNARELYYGIMSLDYWIRFYGGKCTPPEKYYPCNSSKVIDTR